MNMKRSFIRILFLVITQYSILAQDIEFTASVDQNPVPVGERITITYNINAEGADFKGPSFKGFTVMGGPMQGQSVHIVNGRMSRSLSFSYILTADKVGTYTIDPAYISSRGNTYKSNSLKIQVLPESDVQKQQRKQEQDKEKTVNQQANDILKKNILLKAEVNKRSVRQGEQITATYRLYIHPQLNPIQMNPKKIPSFDGFWTTDLNVEKLNWQREVINGIVYNSAIIKQVVLLPQRSGKLQIDPYEFEFIVRLKVEGQKRRSGGLFDDFFGDSFFGDSYRDFNYTAKSEPITINSIALPEGAPESFSGAVGNISMEANFDKTNTKTGEPITLKIKLFGTGNLKLIDSPNIKFPPGFDVYDPKISDNTSVTSSGMVGSVTYEYIVIPRNAGLFRIEPINFSYFDINSSKYKTLNSSEFNIKVEKGINNENSNIVSGVRKEEVELIGKDIRFVKLSTNSLKRYPELFFKSYLFWSLQVLPLILLLLLLLYRRKRLKEAQDMLQFRTRKATHLARKRLASAKKLLKHNENDRFYEEINRALWGYLSDKLIIPNSDLTKDNVKIILQGRNVSDELIDKFMKTLDEAEFARYAPSAANVKNEIIYKDAVEVITNMEGIIK